MESLVSPLLFLDFNTLDIFLIFICAESSCRFVFTAMSYTLVKSLTNNGDNGGETAAGKTPRLVHGVGAGPEAEALGGGDVGDSTDSLVEENLGKMLPS